MADFALGDLAAAGWLVINDGYRTKRSELGLPGVTVLRVAEVQDGHITPTFGDHVGEEYRQKFANKTSLAGDVIVTTKGTVGRVARIGPEDPAFVYAPQLCFFRVLDESQLHPGFLYQWFRGREFRQQALGVQGQTDMAPYINLADMRRIRITLPPLPEQRAIAEVLGALDDKIEVNRNVAGTAEELAQSIAMAVGDAVPVGTVTMVHRKMVPTSFFAGRDVEHFSLPAFDADRMPEVETGDGIKSGKFLLDRPTVLVSKLNPHIPRVWMAVPGGALPAVTSTEFVGLAPVGNYANEVLWALCSTPRFSSQLSEMVKGTTGSHQRVAPEDVLKVLVPNPHALSEDAAATITSAVQLAGAVRRESVHVAALRDTLLPKLLSGELRVRDAPDMVGAPA